MIGWIRSWLRTRAYRRRLAALPRSTWPKIGHFLDGPYAGQRIPLYQPSRYVAIPLQHPRQGFLRGVYSGGDPLAFEGLVAPLHVLKYRFETLYPNGIVAYLQLVDDTPVCCRTAKIAA